MAKEDLELTIEGKEKLEAELDELKNVKRPENVIALKEARALGDLSENAEYDAARNEQAVIEARIKELETILENAPPTTTPTARSKAFPFEINFLNSFNIFFIFI